MVGQAISHYKILAKLGEGAAARCASGPSATPGVMGSPLLDGIRSDPRFQKLFERMGLPR